MLPYGFYLRAMFYNKKLFEEAGVAGPPKTLDEFRAAAEKVSALPGKYGYCLRGGPGGLNGWVMFGATNDGSNAFFNDDGTSTFTDPGWVRGITFLTDLYKDGWRRRTASTGASTRSSPASIPAPARCSTRIPTR